MCIAYLSIGHAQWPLLIAANRDEFHARQSAVAAPWPDHPEVVAGRDLVAGGTWLGWTLQGRYGLLTNYREPGRMASPSAPSRGVLVRDFLIGHDTAKAYVAAIASHLDDWAGFNLIIGDRLGAWYLSNRDPSGRPRLLDPGHYILSNHLLDTPWPKARRLRKNLEAVPADGWAKDPDTIFRILHDTTQAESSELPETGVSDDLELLLSSPFVVSPAYGTRCSTLVAVPQNGTALFSEQSYGPMGVLTERHDWRVQQAD
ncbi:MAG TPA: NRDE family protein [Castellaniella sp.]|uniref:NRDE family protein n=1 Tax=Castellaniella sp. TaxID=1955812 RepID=UPI002F2234DF